MCITAHVSVYTSYMHTIMIKKMMMMIKLWP